MELQMSLSDSFATEWARNKDTNFMFLAVAM
jgi:hypothetical protein